MAAATTPEEPGKAPSLGSRTPGRLLFTGITSATLLVVGIATSALAARLLGPVGRGQFAAVQNVAGLLSALALVGMPDAVTYMTSRHPGASGRWLFTAVVTAEIVALPLVGLAALFLPLLAHELPPDVTSAGRWFLLSVFASIVAGLPFNTLQGSLRFTLWNALRLASPLLWLATLLAAWWLHRAVPVPVAHVLRLYLGAWAIYTGVMLFVTRRAVPPPFTFSPGAARDLLRYGLPCVLGVIPRQLNIRFDQLLMAALLPHRLLGLYAVSVGWSNAFIPLVYAAGQVAFPSIAGVEDAGKRSGVAGQMVRLSVATTALLLLGWAAATPLGFVRLMGEPYRDALPLLLLLLPAAAVSALNAVCADVLKGLGRPKDAMVAELSGLALTLVLLALLLTRYQATGAALASLVSYAGSLALNLHLIGRATGLAPGRLLVPSAEDWGRVLQVARKLPGMRGHSS